MLLEGFEPTSVSAADDSGVRRERCTLTELVSGNHFSGGLNEAFKKASYSLVTYKIHNLNCCLCSWDFFYAKPGNNGFLCLFAWNSLTCIHNCRTPPTTRRSAGEEMF